MVPFFFIHSFTPPCLLTAFVVLFYFILLIMFYFLGEAQKCTCLREECKKWVGAPDPQMRNEELPDARILKASSPYLHCSLFVEGVMWVRSNRDDFAKKSPFLREVEGRGLDFTKKMTLGLSESEFSFAKFCQPPFWFPCP